MMIGSRFQKVSASVLVLFISLLFSCKSEPPATGQTIDTKPQADSNLRSPKNYIGDCKNLAKEARRMDSILLLQTEMDIPSAQKAIIAFTDFAFYCNSDSLSPVYLIKTAQVARAINNIPQAKLVLDKCIDDYPAFKNRAAALFLLAQLYDDPGYLNNEEEARKIYQKIIDEYPKSDWASSAKGAIRFIGKTDDEIMRELTKKKKTN